MIWTPQYTPRMEGYTSWSTPKRRFSRERPWLDWSAPMESFWQLRKISSPNCNASPLIRGYSLLSRILAWEFRAAFQTGWSSYPGLDQSARITRIILGSQFQGRYWLRDWPTSFMLILYMEPTDLWDARFSSPARMPILNRNSNYTK